MRAILTSDLPDVALSSQWRQTLQNKPPFGSPLADGLTEGTISQLDRLNQEQLVNEEEYHGEN